MILSLCVWNEPKRPCWKQQVPSTLVENMGEILHFLCVRHWRGRQENPEGHCQKPFKSVLSRILIKPFKWLLKYLNYFFSRCVLQKDTSCNSAARIQKKCWDLDEEKKKRTTCKGRKPPIPDSGFLALNQVLPKRCPQHNVACKDLVSCPQACSKIGLKPHIYMAHSWLCVLKLLKAKVYPSSHRPFIIFFPF